MAEATVVVDSPAATVPELPSVGVVMCVWNRLGRTTKVLRALAQSIGVRAEVYLWNNRADAAGAIVDALRDCTEPLPQTVLATCAINVGGFGRFYWARSLATTHPSVVFVDDDQVLDPFALRDLVSDWKPTTIGSVWAYKFGNRFEYWHRQQVEPGAAAMYVGTGGMVADSAIFCDDELFECPPRYWFMEDIWLSHYAQTLRGWNLYRSSAEIGMMMDGQDQYHALRDAKNEFYRELNRDGRWFDINK